MMTQDQIKERRKLRKEVVKINTQLNDLGMTWDEIIEFWSACIGEASAIKNDNPIRPDVLTVGDFKPELSRQSTGEVYVKKITGNDVE